MLCVARVYGGEMMIHVDVGPPGKLEMEGVWKCDLTGVGYWDWDFWSVFEVPDRTKGRKKREEIGLVHLRNEIYTTDLLSFPPR